MFTPDNDFIDIDYCGKGNGPLVILLHGLTGSSNFGYIYGKNPLRPGYWLEMRIVEFLRQHWGAKYDALAKREEK